MSPSRVVAITGAASVLGQKLATALDSLEDISRIVLIDIKDSPLKFTKAEFVKGDIRNPLIPEVLRSYQVDTLVHLAFQHNPFKRPASSHEINVLGTLKILNACAAARLSKIIVMSLTAVYGAHYDNPNFLNEKVAPRPNRGFPAIRDCGEVEKLCLEYAQKHPTVVMNILRMGIIVGPSLHSYYKLVFDTPVVPTIMGFDPLVQLVHEEDVIQALTRVIEQEVSGIFNIVGDGVIPLSKAIKLLGKFSLPVPALFLIPLFSLLWKMRLTEVPSALVDYLRFLWVADGSKAKRELGFKPAFTTEQALLDLIEYDRVAGLLEEPDDDLLMPDISTQENLESFIDSRIKKIIDRETLGLPLEELAKGEYRDSP